VLDFAKLREKIKRWWEGELEPPDRGFPILRVIPQYRRHWTARMVRAVFAFVACEWKWIIGVTIAIVGLVVHLARM
jgi:hypothetical protein